jgi:hypothetical protein
VYQFEEAEVPQYLSNLGTFEDSHDVHFWPTIKESLNHADKSVQIRHLDEISKRITHSPRPKTDIITLDRAKKQTEGVLKRTFSDKSCHVMLLPNADPINWQEMERPGTKILLQSLVPTLRSYGELRVGISFGRVIWRVWTRLVGGAYEFTDVTHPIKIVGVPIR